eukprot:CAMPEP_0194502166 /NCGR_PEP_ID=MMETSP0253-20130528/24652_1 /TAXON_ID=2966 /ORGANISM="Noctiluca scintillans" /LENGTH=78 /DNA_ID=CAMNT_0039344267 /DNA_START=38 /DNA_END=274 /DNA_ORIENTATION=+
MGKNGEMVLNDKGVMTQVEGEWSDPQQTATTVWQVLRESKHLLSSSEALKRITVRFPLHDYVITGKDSQYTIVQWTRD